MGVQPIQPRISGNAATVFQSSQPLQQQYLLTSWKEIAAFFGRGVRTVQRWERKFDLPVLRPNGGKGLVIAKVDELEAWIDRNSPRAGEQTLVRSTNNSNDVRRIKELADELSDLAERASRLPRGA